MGQASAWSFQGLKLCLATAFVCMSPTEAVAQDAQRAPTELRAIYGRPTTDDLLEALLAPAGWEKRGGMLLAHTAWQHSPSVALKSFRSNDSLLLVTAIQDEGLSQQVGGPHSVWRITDGINVLHISEGEDVTDDCKIGMHGDWVPGLVAVVDYDAIVSESDASALVGPARMAFHVDRVDGRLTREVLPVYCDKPDYGV